MNIHPIMVHFPVAFLTIYCLAELVRLKRVTSLAYWFYIKAFLVIVGAAGSIAAYLTGEIAQTMWGESQLIETHSHWAKATMMLFVTVAVIYGIAWLSRLEIYSRIENRLGIRNIGVYRILKELICNLAVSPIMVIPALFGLVCVLVTGALGGAIVYGPDNDPFIRVLYNVLVQ